MKIMIDYDGTFTEDTHAWTTIIDYMIGRGHDIYLVTSRDPANIVEDAGWFEAHGVPIIYCGYKAKRQVCEQQGIAIDIWIDNQPYFIDHGYPEEEAKKWRVG